MHKVNNCAKHSSYKAPKLQQHHYLMHSDFMHKINIAENE